MPIKKDNLNFLGFPRRERPKVPHFSFSPSLDLPAWPLSRPVYAIKSEPTTTSRRLTDRHEFWIGATTDDHDQARKFQIQTEGDISADHGALALKSPPCHSQFMNQVERAGKNC